MPASVTTRPWSTARRRPRPAPRRGSARATPLNDASRMWWVLLPVPEPDVQRDAGGGREGPPELLRQLRVEGGGCPVGGVGTELDVVGEERPTREVERHLDERLVEGHGDRREPPDAGLVPERLGAAPRRGRCRRPPRCGGRRPRGRPCASTDEVEAPVLAELARPCGRRTGCPVATRHVAACRRDRATTSIAVSFVSPASTAPITVVSCQGLGQRGQEGVVLLRRPHRDPQAVGRARASADNPAPGPSGRAGLARRRRRGDHGAGRG